MENTNLDGVRQQFSATLLVQLIERADKLLEMAANVLKSKVKTGDLLLDKHYDTLMLRYFGVVINIAKSDKKYLEDLLVELEQQLKETSKRTSVVGEKLTSTRDVPDNLLSFFEKDIVKSIILNDRIRYIKSALNEE